MVILSRSCHDLAMILASVPCIMISHDLDKGTMVNHDLARLTMIMARMQWLRTLGNQNCREAYLLIKKKSHLLSVEAIVFDKRD